MTPDNLLELEDHDQRFKALIREFFADFLRLFFADWAARFDLTRIEWLDKELFAEPPDGSRHILDLVAKLHTLEPVQDSDTWLALVHIEVESPDRTTALKPRLPAYYMHLSRHYGLPVLPIVLYLKVGLDGLGTDFVVERFWELEVLRFQYLYVGLPGLNAEDYIAGENWLGVALSALMRIPKDRILELGVEAIRRIGQARLTEQQRYLLGECVESYLPLPAEEEARFQAIMEGNSTGKVPPMRKTTFDRLREQHLQDKEAAWNTGREEGLSLGRRAAMIELLEAQLESQYGAISEVSLEKLRSLSDERLREIALAFPKAESLADLCL